MNTLNTMIAKLQDRRKSSTTLRVPELLQRLLCQGQILMTLASRVQSRVDSNYNSPLLLLHTRYRVRDKLQQAM